MSDLDGMPEEPTGDEFARDGFFPEQEERKSSRRPLTGRGLALVGGRTAIGVAGIAAATLAIAASMLLPLPTVQSTATGIRISPVPTAQQLVCPGAILRLASDSGQDATASSGIGSPVVSSGSSTGDVDSVAVTTSEAGTGDTGAAPTIISTPPDAADPTQRILLSGAQSQQLDSGDYIGLAAADCGTATGDSWLAGGATTVGRTTLLTLTNPTEVAATVNLELFGENGTVEAPGTSGIIVPADGQRVLSLAGFQPGLTSPVVRVASTGGRVHATLQQSVLRGLIPGGLDIIEPSSGPDTQNIIPGVVVTDPDNVQALRNAAPASEIADDFTTALRLFSPADGASTVRVTVLPENGGTVGQDFEFQLEGGVVRDLPLQELAAGQYTFIIRSEAPTLASVRVSSAAASAASGSTAATDFAWFTPSEELAAPAQFTAAEAPSPVLHLYNPGSSVATATLTALGAAPVPVTVPAGASVAAPVDAGASYTLDGFSALYGAVSVSGGGMLARYTVHPPGIGSSPITVYP